MRDIVDEIVDGYLECAQWAEDPDEGPEWAEAEWGYGQRSKARMIAMAFLYAAREPGNGLDIWADEFGWERIGHDLWLTTRGHGAGFWDRHYEVDRDRRDEFLVIGDNLTEICKSPDFDSVGAGAYLGDDGKLYIGG